jgi:hypothetical protein
MRCQVDVSSGRDISKFSALSPIFPADRTPFMGPPVGRRGWGWCRVAATDPVGCWCGRGFIHSRTLPSTTFAPRRRSRGRCGWRGSTVAGLFPSPTTFRAGHRLVVCGSERRGVIMLCARCGLSRLWSWRKSSIITLASARQVNTSTAACRPLGAGAPGSLVCLRDLLQRLILKHLIGHDPL